MNVTDMPVERLIPYARNPRNNSAAIDAVKASIAEFGFRQPIVVDEKLVVIVGHTRLEAAKQLGLKTVPVHVAEGLTPAQAKAYRLMDNRSHENAEWDDDLLRLEFGDLKLDDFDLALTGFVSEELDKLLGAEQIEGLTDPDEAPAVPEVPVSKPGDLWILGDHRVLCGDSTVMTDVEKLMGGQQVMKDIATIKADIQDIRARVGMLELDVARIDQPSIAKRFDAIEGKIDKLYDFLLERLTKLPS